MLPQQHLELVKISIHLDDYHSWRLMDPSKTLRISDSPSLKRTIIPYWATVAVDADATRSPQRNATHSWLVVHRQEDVLSRTACEPEGKLAPVRVQHQIRIERIRVNDGQISRLIIRRRGCLFTFRHFCGSQHRGYELAKLREVFHPQPDRKMSGGKVRGGR